MKPQRRPFRRTSELVLLAAALSACGGLLYPERGISTSIEFEPPREWESAVLFSFADSTYFPAHPYAARVELAMEGHRRRVITGRDLFTSPAGGLLTPWHRIPLRGANTRLLVFRVVLTDTSGAESVADYPLQVKRDHFYEVHFGVATPRPPRPEAPPATEGRRWYPVAPTARLLPTDSLLISYLLRTRDCFGCPF